MVGAVLSIIMLELGRFALYNTSGATFHRRFSNDTNGNATFSITVTNSSGNKILVTNYDITDGSFVTIDTVKPIIILNGNSDDTVLQGNNYVDLGANVSDPNNPSYTQTITALPTNLNTSSLGEQNITYSALADAAGNVPDSINRTVTVQAKPLGLETLTIESNNTKNNMYAKIGDKITITLVANGYRFCHKYYCIKYNHTSAYRQHPCCKLYCRFISF